MLHSTLVVETSLNAEALCLNLESKANIKQKKSSLICFQNAMQSHYRMIEHLRNKSEYV